MSIKREPITWYLVCACFLAVIVQIVLFVTSGVSWLVGDGSDGADEAEVQDSRDVAAIEQPTPYLDRVAQELRQNPIWIDPLLAHQGSRWVDESVEGAVRNTETPVYVAVLPSGEVDGSGDNQELTLARLSNAVGVEGVYYLVSGDRFTAFETVDDRAIEPDPNYAFTFSPTDLAASIESVDAPVGEDSQDLQDQVLMGVFLGIPWLVVGWFVSRWIQRAGRRNTSYMEGFSA